MESWDLRSLEVEPHQPRILSTTDEARTILLRLPAGEQLGEHEVHERAWVLVVDGEIEMGSADGERTSATDGHLFEFVPRERHEVVAVADARLLLLLAPWPGDGHPGTMTLEQKGAARERAARSAQ